MNTEARTAIEEEIRFLQIGAEHAISYDEHVIAIVRRHPDATTFKGGGFVVVCVTCDALVARDAPHRRVAVEIHKHTTEPAPPRPTSIPGGGKILLS